MIRIFLAALALVVQRHTSTDGYRSRSASARKALAHTWRHGPRRAYRNLIYFHEVDKGGHFAAWEEPELFSAELRAAFRSLRPAR